MGSITGTPSDNSNTTACHFVSSEGYIGLTKPLLTQCETSLLAKGHNVILTLMSNVVMRKGTQDNF